MLATRIVVLPQHTKVLHGFCECMCSFLQCVVDIWPSSVRTAPINTSFCQRGWVCGPMDCLIDCLSAVVSVFDVGTYEQTAYSPLLLPTSACCSEVLVWQSHKAVPRFGEVSVLQASFFANTLMTLGIVLAVQTWQLFAIYGVLCNDRQIERWLGLESQQYANTRKHGIVI